MKYLGVFECYCDSCNGYCCELCGKIHLDCTYLTGDKDRLYDSHLDVMQRKYPRMSYYQTFKNRFLRK